MISGSIDGRAEGGLPPHLVTAGVCALPEPELLKLKEILDAAVNEKDYALKCSRFLLERFTRTQLIELEIALNPRLEPKRPS